MASEQQPEAPIAFISYSHDSDAHKEWVRRLASDLRDRYGIDVILDQWEIGPGDDVPKFMERSVKRALRVLMVCTEPYVRKADDGKGGAGYEAMVVTSELVSDLGTRKFIPLVRQLGGNSPLPTCVATRFYIDFSKDDTFDEKLEELARSIHQSPKFEKPPLGANPFANHQGKSDQPPALQPLVELGPEIDMYRKSVSMADVGDFAKWRDLIHRAKTSSAAALSNWRSANQNNLPKTVDGLPDYFFPAVATHSGLFAAAFGAFDSKDQRFHNQLSLIDEIRNPKGWERSGNTIYTELPDLILFSYQALMGGLAISRHNFDAALKLATTPLESRYSGRDSLPLFKSTWAMGWPESMNHTCTLAWKFLMKLTIEWKWLHDLFGSEDDTKAAISAYYAFLNTLDGVSAIKAAMVGKPKDRAVTVPVCFVVIDDDTKRKAKTLFFSNPTFLAGIFADNSVPDSEIARYWTYWVELCVAWIGDVYKERFWGTPNAGLFHASLPSDIAPSQGKRIIE